MAELVRYWCKSYEKAQEQGSYAQLSQVLYAESSRFVSEELTDGRVTNEFFKKLICPIMVRMLPDSVLSGKTASSTYNQISSTAATVSLST